MNFSDRVFSVYFEFFIVLLLYCYIVLVGSIKSYKISL